MWARLWAWVNKAQATPRDHLVTDATVVPDGERLIVQVEVYVEARCQCGSDHIHRLSLVTTSHCVRCSRTLGLRSFQYYRPTVEALPDPVVTVGYVVTRETLARQPTSPVLH